jgi:hypothetical protein
VDGLVGVGGFVGVGVGDGLVCRGVCDGLGARVELGAEAGLAAGEAEPVAVGGGPTHR